jgi:dTDP-4-dehydrorhamnose reductase
MVAPGGILVFGAGGLLGRAIISAKAPSGLNVVGLRRAEADITDAAAVERIVAQVRPTVIVNAAGYAAVDRAESEPDLAFAVNADGAGNLAAAGREVGASLVHLSTDYVFDGADRSPYREDHPVAPVNAYGQSKAAGERAVREATDRHVIVRTAWLYGRHGRSFVSTMLKLAADHDDVNVVDDQRGTPTSAADLSDAILAIAARLAAGGAGYGTFHVTNAGETTWHGLAKRVFAELSRRGLKAPRLNPIPTSAYPTQARRPAYSVLDCTRIGSAYGIVPRPWEAALDDELAAMINGAGKL